MSGGDCDQHIDEKGRDRKFNKGDASRSVGNTDEVAAKDGGDQVDASGGEIVVTHDCNHFASRDDEAVEVHGGDKVVMGIWAIAFSWTYSQPVPLSAKTFALGNVLRGSVREKV